MKEITPNTIIDDLYNNFDSFLDFLDFYFKFRPYNYQKDFLKKCLTSRRILGIFCRQSGKSTTVAVYCLFRAITGKITIIITSPTQSQSDELYLKIKTFAGENENINNLIEKDTMKELRFANGSRILSLPCGNDGRTIRGYSGDIVVIEEAGIMKDKIVNQVIMPMIASKKEKGQVIKIGTPLIKNHFYTSCYKDKHYQTQKVTYEDCLLEGVYDEDFIEEQKENLLDVEFRSEYCSEFVSEENMFFSDKLVEFAQLEYPIIMEV